MTESWDDTFLGTAPGPRGVVAWFGRQDLRRRWRVVVATGLLVGAVAGIGLACLAGARRTDTLFERHLAASRGSDVEIDPGTPTPANDEAIRSMPEVIDAGYWTTIGAFLLNEDGGIDERAAAGALVFTTDGRYIDQDRLAVHAGRRLDPTRPDEVMINQFAADVLGAHVGSEIAIGTAPTDEYGYPPPGAPPTQRFPVRVVGIMAPPDEVVGVQLDRIPKLFVSPAFSATVDPANPVSVGYSWYGLRLRNGEADVDAVVARWRELADAHNAAAPDGADPWLSYFHRTSDLRRTADRALRPMVAALLTFGGLALLGALILLAQSMARMVREGQEDIRIGQVLGMTTSDASRASLTGPLVTVGVAATVAAALMLALSHLFPAGPYGVLEPAPGFDVDPLVLGVGLLVLVVVPLSVAAIVARRQAVRNLRAAGPVIRPSRIASGLAGTGLPPSILSAVRLTLQPTRGRTYVPTRLVLVSLAVTVMLLVTTLVFGDNLASLAKEPERFGWRADALLITDGGYGAFEPASTKSWLESRHEITGWEMAGAGTTTVGDREIPAVVFGDHGGDGADLVPVIVSGRAPSRAGEVAVGRRTLDELGRDVGDEFELGEGESARRVRVTGVAVFPELGPVLAVRTRLDAGIWVHTDDVAAIPSLADYESPDNMLLVDLAAGHSLGAFRDAVGASPLSADAGTDSYGVLRPAEVDTAASASRAQSGLVAAVAVVAVVSLFLTLMAVVRRRRRDLAILTVLGFTPGQLRLTVMTQGFLFGLVATVVGVPLGLALGRELWRRFAQTLGVVADPSVPWATLGIAALAVMVIAVLSALVPALAVGRRRATRLALE